MNPLQTWIAENFVLFLALALAVSAALLLAGAWGAWRSGRRLRQRPRPVVRFVVALVASVAGFGGTVLFTLGLFEVAPASRDQERMIGRPAPALVFTKVDGETEGKLSDLRGQVVLVNLWATWCPPCTEEMPALDRLQKHYAGQGLTVLQISDEDRETVAAYLAKQPMSTLHGIAQPIPWPEFGRPTTFIVDREGVVRRAFHGARDYAGFTREIEDYL